MTLQRTPTVSTDVASRVVERRPMTISGQCPLPYFGPSELPQMRQGRGFCVWGVPGHKPRSSTDLHPSRCTNRDIDGTEPERLGSSFSPRSRAMSVAGHGATLPVVRLVPRMTPGGFGDVTRPTAGRRGLLETETGVAGHTKTVCQDVVPETRTHTSFPHPGNREKRVTTN